MLLSLINMPACSVNRCQVVQVRSYFIVLWAKSFLEDRERPEVNQLALFVSTKTIEDPGISCRVEHGARIVLP